MTDTEADTARQGETGTADVLGELRAWLRHNWDPDLTVGQWWELLGLAGWSAPNLPAKAYGKNMARTDAVLVSAEIAKFGALGAPAGLGLLLAAPTIAAHGTQEQIDRYVREIVTGKKAWCQLFSEPQAGSDLAGLQTRAGRDGDEWVVNGQKVWTSGGQFAELGMLLARTDPEVPKHAGISYFALEMHQDGVDVRPLKEMTGHALFNEVFLTDARVTDSALIGGLNNGWAAAHTTLMNERAGLGSGGGNIAGGIGSAQPGVVLGFLERRVGDVVAGRSSAAGRGSVGDVTHVMKDGAGFLTRVAQQNGTNRDPLVRQELVRLYTLGELGRFNGLRMKAANVPGMPNMAKLSMSQMVRMTRDLGLRIIGAAGMLHAYVAEGRAGLAQAHGNPFAGEITEMALFAQAPPIYGGTDQVQRNIIGERVLGLPREPSNDRSTPFSELPKNA